MGGRVLTQVTPESILNWVAVTLLQETIVLAFLGRFENPTISWDRLS